MLSLAGTTMCACDRGAMTHWALVPGSDRYRDHLRPCGAAQLPCEDGKLNGALTHLSTKAQGRTSPPRPANRPKARPRRQSWRERGRTHYDGGLRHAPSKALPHVPASQTPLGAEGAPSKHTTRDTSFRDRRHRLGGPHPPQPSSLVSTPNAPARPTLAGARACEAAPGNVSAVLRLPADVVSANRRSRPQARPAPSRCTRLPH